jgi:hypothetical protein
MFGTINKSKTPNINVKTQFENRSNITFKGYSMNSHIFFNSKYLCFYFIKGLKRFKQSAYLKTVGLFKYCNRWQCSESDLQSKKPIHHN